MRNALTQILRELLPCVWPCSIEPVKDASGLADDTCRRPSTTSKRSEERTSGRPVNWQAVFIKFLRGFVGRLTGIERVLAGV
ncbi:MAG: hypothetical protein MRJ65_15420 [Candidatus Brocadiaceae bacterium]|nr:hypothetical protein [Candidatus Brocadiaceae bacterium]